MSCSPVENSLRVTDETTVKFATLNYTNSYSIVIIISFWLLQLNSAIVFCPHTVNVTNSAYFIIKSSTC